MVTIVASILVFTVTEVWTEKETVASVWISALMPTSVCAPGQRTAQRIIHLVWIVMHWFNFHGFALFGGWQDWAIFIAHLIGV
jgi:hypothetical protein